MLTYAQIQRERPGRITFLAIVALLIGIPMLLLGIAAGIKLLSMADLPDAFLFWLLWAGVGGVAIATGLGLLKMKPWARIAGVIACALGTVSTLQGLPEIFRERSILNIVLNVAILLAQIWVGYYLLQPSTRELFVQAQGDDERVFKI
jgi:hypothetical protein